MRHKTPYILVMGDIHGDYKPVKNLVNRIGATLQKNLNEQRENILILLGDAGINYFFNNRDDEFKRKLSRYPLTYFVIRGNHEQRPSIIAEENRADWEWQVFFDNVVFVEKKYPNIKYAADGVTPYHIPSVKGRKYSTLVIPGAYSVDKWRRLQAGWSWFPQEQLSEKEMQQGLKLIKAIRHFDIILSHTCSVTFEPTDLFLPVVDQSIVDKTMEHYINQIEYNIDYKVHLWGHYHQYREYPRESGIPSYKNQRHLMLFNDCAVSLEDVMNNQNSVTKL